MSRFYDSGDGLEITRSSRPPDAKPNSFFVRTRTAGESTYLEWVWWDGVQEIPVVTFNMTTGRMEGDALTEVAWLANAAQASADAAMTFAQGIRGIRGGVVVIGATGAVTRAFGIISATRTGVGAYTIEHNHSNPYALCSVTGTAGIIPYLSVSGSNLVHVNLRTTAGVAADANFHLQIF